VKKSGGPWVSGRRLQFAGEQVYNPSVAHSRYSIQDHHLLHHWHYDDHDPLSSPRDGGPVVYRTSGPNAPP
jgi:hypothetical protein